MMIDFSKVKIGGEYDRKQLAALWGYKDFHAIARGVLTSTNSNIIVLFVTREKPSWATQYKDYLDGNLLHWEGEDAHGSDARIIASQQHGDEIHLFYREIHKAPFVYYGKIRLQDCEERAQAPSKFVFEVAG